MVYGCVFIFDGRGTHTHTYGISQLVSTSVADATFGAKRFRQSSCENATTEIFWVVKPRQDECMWRQFFNNEWPCVFNIPTPAIFVAAQMLSYIFAKWGVYICTAIFRFFFICCRLTPVVLVCAYVANEPIICFIEIFFTSHLNRRQSNHFGALGHKTYL